MSMHPQPRLDVMKQAPELLEAFVGASTIVAARPEIDEGLALLVDVRASQLNGCAFCLDMHVKQARMRGERELRLHHVAIWRESPLFTPQERAALAWTEAVTQLPPTGVPDALYDEVREHFGEKALATLTFRIMTINAWNRLNVAFRSPPGSRDKLFGLEQSGLS